MANDLTVQFLDSIAEKLAGLGFRRTSRRSPWQKPTGEKSNWQVRIDTISRAGLTDINVYFGVVLPELEVEVEEFVAASIRPRESWTLCADLHTLLFGQFANYSLRRQADVSVVCDVIEAHLRSALESDFGRLVASKQIADFLFSHDQRIPQLIGDVKRLAVRCVLLAHQAADRCEAERQCARLISRLERESLGLAQRARSELLSQANRTEDDV